MYLKSLHQVRTRPGSSWQEHICVRRQDGHLDRRETDERSVDVWHRLQDVERGWVVHGRITPFGDSNHDSPITNPCVDLSITRTKNSFMIQIWLVIRPCTKVEAKGNVPSPRSFHSSVVVGECIYVFGGCPAEGRMSDLHMFDTRTKGNVSSRIE